MGCAQLQGQGEQRVGGAGGGRRQVGRQQRGEIWTQHGVVGAVCAQTPIHAPLFCNTYTITPLFSLATRRPTHQPVNAPPPHTHTQDVSTNQRELEQQAVAGGGASGGGANPAAAAAAAVDLISLDDFAMPAPPPVLATGGAGAPQGERLAVGGWRLSLLSSRGGGGWVGWVGWAGLAPRGQVLALRRVPGPGSVGRMCGWGCGCGCACGAGAGASVGAMGVEGHRVSTREG